jgi:hypothetical protein
MCVCCHRIFTTYYNSNYDDMILSYYNLYWNLFVSKKNDFIMIIIETLNRKKTGPWSAKLVYICMVSVLRTRNIYYSLGCFCTQAINVLQCINIYPEECHAPIANASPRVVWTALLLFLNRASQRSAHQVTYHQHTGIVNASNINISHLVRFDASVDDCVGVFSLGLITAENVLDLHECM